MAKKKTKKKDKFSDKLLKRAKGIIPPTRIELYADEESLKAACDRLSPQTNPDHKVQAAPEPEVPTQPSNEVPDEIEFESKLQCSFFMQNRAMFDENNLQSELRRINRKYGHQQPIEIKMSRRFEQVKGKDKQRRDCKVFVTNYIIVMKG